MSDTSELEAREAERRKPDAEIHSIPRTESEILNALSRLCAAAYRPGVVKPIFSIPPQRDDADIILYDAFVELQQLRTGVKGLRAGITKMLRQHTPTCATHFVTVEVIRNVRAWDDELFSNHYPCDCGAEAQNKQIGELLARGWYPRPTS